jgi:acyl-CoA synthetase (AMP-forming)/AMP-acid ligase II
MLADVVREAARRFGPSPVLVDPDGRPLAYEDLDRRSDEVATGMNAKGIGPGSVVGLALPTCSAYAVAYAAAAKVGAATAGVNPRLTEPEQRGLLDVVEPDLVLRTEDEVQALAVGGGRPPALDADPDRLVAIVFTSGTTGTPKGAMFTAASWRRSARPTPAPAGAGAGRRSAPRRWPTSGS